MVSDHNGRDKAKENDLEPTYADAVLVVPEVAGRYRWMMTAIKFQPRNATPIKVGMPT
jgi:hypothetical protein